MSDIPVELTDPTADLAEAMRARMGITDDGGENDEVEDQKLEDQQEPADDERESSSYPEAALTASTVGHDTRRTGSTSSAEDGSAGSARQAAASAITARRAQRPDIGSSCQQDNSRPGWSHAGSDPR